MADINGRILKVMNSINTISSTVAGFRFGAHIPLDGALCRIMSEWCLYYFMHIRHFA